jgi:predicted acyltransferase
MPEAGDRWLALDAFRGLSVAGMILVNNPGSWSYVYPPLAHAEWHGWTPTDLIFPFFLFAVGVAMTFSLGRRVQAGTGRPQLLRRILWRSLLIIGFGLLLNGFPAYQVSTLRFPGVLQRIGVYLFAATAYLLLPSAGQRRLAAGLLLGYWAAMTLVPIPGVGAGSLTVDANLAQYLDSRIFAGHTWKPTWDPEGLLSTVPAIATCLLGAFAGDWMASSRDRRDRVLSLFVAGAAIAMAGWVWSIWFPINKNLWTSSYVLLTGGFAAMVLAWLSAVIDLYGRRRWAWPFYVYGSNALLVFLLTGCFARVLNLVQVTGPAGTTEPLKQVIYERAFASWAGPLNGSLAFAVAFVLLWLALMAVPYRYKFLFKV